jgi:MFS family permease
MDSEVTSTPRSSPYATLLRNRDFSLLVLAYAVNTFGNWITVVAAIALATFTWEVTPVQLGGLIAVFIGPAAVVSPLAGWLGDRLNKKRLLIFANVASAGVIIWMPFIDSIWHAYALLLFLRTLSSVNQPVMSAMIPSLVGRGELMQANGIFLQPAHLTRAISPLIGGVMVALIGASAAFVLNSITFLVAAGILVLIVSARRPQVEAFPAAAQAGDRLRRLLMRPRFLALGGVALTASFALGSLESAAPLYIRELLDGNAALYGATISCIGVGSIAGALAPGVVSQGWDRLRGIVLATFVIALGFALMAAVQHTAALLVGTFVGGLGVGAALTIGQTMIHTEMPERNHSTALGFFAALANSGTIAGIFIAAMLITAIGVAPMLWVAAIGMAVMLPAAFRPPRMAPVPG